MSITHHALTNADLGEYKGAEHNVVNPGEGIKKWETVFNYEEGYVVLNPDWKYQTFLDKDIRPIYDYDPEMNPANLEH